MAENSNNSQGFGARQAFVLKYADGDKLFTDEIVLERKN
jgi:hypothetical protein